MASNSSNSTENRVLWTVVLAVSLINIGLLYQNQQLRSRQPQPVAPQVGSRLGFFELTDIDGQAVKLELTGAPLLLLFTSPTCHFCDEQYPAWTRLATVMQGTNTPEQPRVVVVMDDAHRPAAREYISTHPVPGATFGFASGETLARNHLSSTPATIEVAPGGSITAVWLGAWSPAIHSEVELHFGLPAGSLQSVTSFLPRDASKEHLSPL